jgi:hypothetical protein
MQLEVNMKRVTLALFSGFLVIVFAGVAISPKVNGQTEVSTEELLGVIRTINTAEVSYADEFGRYASREEMLAFLRKPHASLMPSPIDFRIPKLYELALNTSPDGKHYQITLKGPSDMNDKSTWCKTAAFSDEAGVIFLGSAIDCESPTR